MSFKEVEKLSLTEWNQTKNLNSFVFLEFLKMYPHFLDLKVKRGEPNKRFYVVKKPLFDRLVNKMMSKSKTTGGKKLTCQKLLRTCLESKAKAYSMLPQELLFLLIIKSVPNYTVRRIKYGSGFLTRIVVYTVLKKISWFLKTFMKAVCKRNKRFKDCFDQEVDLMFNKSSKSVFLAAKREDEVSGLRAQIR